MLEGFSASSFLFLLAYLFNHIMQKIRGGGRPDLSLVEQVDVGTDRRIDIHDGDIGNLSRDVQPV